jgi:hypothetical protein
MLPASQALQHSNVIRLFAIKLCLVSPQDHINTISNTMEDCMTRKHMLSSLLAVSFFCLSFYATPGEAAKAKITISQEGQVCIACRESQSPSYVQEWRLSRHAEKEVDCYSCHKAKKSDPDAMDQMGLPSRSLTHPKIAVNAMQRKKRR